MNWSAWIEANRDNLSPNGVDPAILNGVDQYWLLALPNGGTGKGNDYVGKEQLVRTAMDFAAERRLGAKNEHQQMPAAVMVRANVIKHNRMFTVPVTVVFRDLEDGHFAATITREQGARLEDLDLQAQMFLN